MDHYKETVVPQRVEKRLTHTTCDMCDADVDECVDNFIYGVDEVTIERSVGSRYPEGTNLEEYKVDLCGKCFAEKLVPWLRSQGAEVRKRDIEY